MLKQTAALLATTAVLELSIATLDLVFSATTPAGAVVEGNVAPREEAPGPSVAANAVDHATAAAQAVGQAAAAAQAAVQSSPAVRAVGHAASAAKKVARGAVGSRPDPDAPARAPRNWAPPAWLPEGGSVSPWAVEILDGAPTHEDGPRLRARAALVADLDSGEVLWSQRADEVLPVASLTKMVSALTLLSQEVDLDRSLCVTPEQYPTRSGARSRFETGVCHAGWDWLGGALVASDNRGAMGLATLSDQPYDAFIEGMAATSADLGMQFATWSDPSGIEEDNRASARDMAKAVVALASHPTLGLVASAPTWQIDRKNGPYVLHTTNRLVERWETLAAKTGYTDPARYCFAQVVRTDRGNTYVTVVLGAPTSSARFDDSSKLVTWAESLR